MLTVDIVETDVLILGFDLEELAHEVVAVIHDDLLGHRGETVTKLHRLEGERQHLAGFLDIIDRRGSIANLRLSIKLKIARLELRLTRTALERIELLLIQVEFGTGGEAAALRLEHVNTHITTGLSLIEPKIGHLAGAIIIIGRAQIDRERALLVGVLEQVILTVRDIHGELLEGTVGTLDVAACVTDRLEGAVRSLTAIDRQIDRKLLRVALARTIARMIVGGEVTVDQSLISAAFVGSNGRSRHSPALASRTTESPEASSTSSSAAFMYLFSLEGCQWYVVRPVRRIAFASTALKVIVVAPVSFMVPFSTSVTHAPSAFWYSSLYVLTRPVQL